LCEESGLSFGVRRIEAAEIDTEGSRLGLLFSGRYYLRYRPRKRSETFRETLREDI
jgi:hypothetical protein